VRAVIVAGGLGTRMGPLGQSLPKSLLPLGGRPLLAHQIDQLGAAGLRDVTVLAGHRAEAVEQAREELERGGARLRIAVDPWPAGSGGCLRHAFPDGEDLLVLFGDIALDMDLGELLRFHAECGGLATAVVHPNDHPWDSDLVELGGEERDDRIVALHRKPHPPDLLVRNLVIAGVFVLTPELVRAIPQDRPCDLVHGVLAPAIERDEPVYGYETGEYLKDMGTPERYAAVREDWERGLAAALHRTRRRPAAFLDRDGTINRHAGLISRPEQIELLPGAARAVRRLNRSGVRAVVVTNQSVVARGLCDEAGLARIHARLEMALGAEGAFLDAIYYCPHHPDRGYPGEIERYKIACECRKPEPGMIQAAARDLAIDLSRSALFGDSQCDLEAAQRAGLPGYQVGQGMDLEQAVEAWLATGAAEPAPCFGLH
jgi:histidinol-phosphate phosphatase family protein